MAIRKIKLPNEQEPREIGALSSNVIYDAVTPTVSLNQKISSMDQIIEGLNSFEIAVVNSLPTQDIDDHTIYFVPQSQGSTTHDEYMYINNTWELIGTTTIDLSDYVTETELTTALTPYVTASSLTTTLDSRYVNVTGDVMSGTLTLNNDSNLIFTKNDELISISPSFTAYPAINLFYENTEDFEIGDVFIKGVETPNPSNSEQNHYAANKIYVDNKVAAITHPVYSLSMSGATITLLADNVAASTITLPIYDGTIQ